MKLSKSALEGFINFMKYMKLVNYEGSKLQMIIG